MATDRCLLRVVLMFSLAWVLVASNGCTLSETPITAARRARERAALQAGQTSPQAAQEAQAQAVSPVSVLAIPVPADPPQQQVPAEPQQPAQPPQATQAIEARVPRDADIHLQTDVDAARVASSPAYLRCTTDSSRLTSVRTSCTHKHHVPAESIISKPRDRIRISGPDFNLKLGKPLVLLSIIVFISIIDSKIVFKIKYHSSRVY